MEAVGAADDLRSLKVRPRACEASTSRSHICLYRKVGAGSLCMDVLQPDTETLKQYLQQLDTGCISIDKTAKIPFSELASVCAVLHWSPASDKDKLIRILFTGSCPQIAVFKGLAEWREREASTMHPSGKTTACPGDFRNEATTNTHSTSEADAKNARQITKMVENFANKETKTVSKTRRGKRGLETERGADVRKNNATKSDPRAKGKMNAKCSSNVSIDANVKMSAKRTATASKGKSPNCKQAAVTTKQGKVTSRDTESVTAAKTDEAKNDTNLCKPTCAEAVYHEGTGDLDKIPSTKYSTVCSETEKAVGVRENEEVTFTCNDDVTVVDAVEPSVTPVIHSMIALEERGPSSNVSDSKDLALAALAPSSESEIGDKTDDGEAVRSAIENLSEIKVSAEDEKKVEINQMCKARNSEAERVTLMEGSAGKLIQPNDKKGSACQKNHSKEEEMDGSDKDKPIGEDQEKTVETQSTRENKEEIIVKEKLTNDDDCTTEPNRQSFIEKDETDEKQSDKNQELKLSEGDDEALSVEGKCKDEQSNQNCKEKDALREEDHGKKTSSRTQKHQIGKMETNINGVERIDKTKCLSGSSNYDDNNSTRNSREKLTPEHKDFTEAEHICNVRDTDESRSVLAEMFDKMDSTLDRADSLDDLNPIKKSPNQNPSTIYPHQPPADVADVGAFNLRDMLGSNGFSSLSLNPFRGMLSEEQANPVFETLEKPLLKDSIMFGRRDIDEDSLDGEDNFDPKQEWDEPMYLPEPDNPDSGRSKPSPGENLKAGCLAENSSAYPVAEEALRTEKEGFASSVTPDVPVGCISGVKEQYCGGNATLKSGGVCESIGFTGMFTRYEKILMNHDMVNNSESEETNATVTKDPSVNNKQPKSNANTLSPDVGLDQRILSESVYLDVAFIPRGGDPGCVDQEFFKFVRSRCYVLSSNCDDFRALDQLLVAKECWNDDCQVTVVPTHDTRELRDWKTAHTFDLIRLNIDIKEPADRCEINLWGPGEKGFLASCVEFKKQLPT